MDSIQVLTVLMLVGIVLFIIVSALFDPLHLSSPSRKRKRSMKTHPEEESLRSFAAGEAAIHNPALYGALAQKGKRAKTPDEEAAESFAMGEFAVKEGENDEEDD
jgi:hypothetical protein